MGLADFPSSSQLSCRALVPGSPLKFSAVVIPYLTKRGFLKTRRDGTQRKLARRMLFLLGSPTYLAGLWAIGMNFFVRYNKPAASVLWNIVYVVLKSTFKTFLLAPCAVQLVPNEFMILGFAAEIDFARLQAATVPFIQDDDTFVALFMLEIVGTLFQFCSGPDRLQLMLHLWLPRYLHWNRRAWGILNKHYGGQMRNCSGKLRLTVEILLSFSSKEICTLALRASHKDVRKKNAWIQRAQWHSLNCVGNAIVATIVRCNHVATVWFMTSVIPHYFPSTKIYIYDGFQFDGLELKLVSGYAFGLIAATTVALLLIQVYLCWYRTLDMPEKRLKKGKQLVNVGVFRLVDAIFRQDFCFFFVWLLHSQVYVVASMVKMFGFDFTLFWRWKQMALESSIFILATTTTSS